MAKGWYGKSLDMAQIVCLVAGRKKSSAHQAFMLAHKRPLRENRQTSCPCYIKMAIYKVILMCLLLQVVTAADVETSALRGANATLKADISSAGGPVVLVDCDSFCSSRGYIDFQCTPTCCCKEQVDGDLHCSAHRCT